MFFAALWSPAGKGLTSWLSFVVLNCVFVTFPCGVLGRVWCLVISFPDLCPLSYFVNVELKKNLMSYLTSLNNCALRKISVEKHIIAFLLN